MQLPKKYIHDKLMLLLASGNIFLAFLCSVLVFLRLSTPEGSDSFIVEYRANLGIGAFKAGSSFDMINFAIFAVLMATLVIVISMNVYRIRRFLSAIVLSAGLVLIVSAIIVSNALLALG